MRRVSVRTGRTFSPARNVLSITPPVFTFLSLERTNAPPLPGFTCWNSTIRKIWPSTSMWLPFLNWFVEIMGRRRLAMGGRRKRRPQVGDDLLGLVAELPPGDADDAPAR